MHSVMSCLRSHLDFQFSPISLLSSCFRIDLKPFISVTMEHVASIEADIPGSPESFICIPATHNGLQSEGLCVHWKDISLWHWLIQSSCPSSLPIPWPGFTLHILPLLLDLLGGTNSGSFCFFMKQWRSLTVTNPVLSISGHLIFSFPNFVAVGMEPPHAC